MKGKTVFSTFNFLKQIKSQDLKSDFFDCRLSRGDGERKGIVYLDSQWPLSGVNSIMIKISAQPGEDGGCTARPPPFTISTIMYKVAVYAPAERQ
jgi:hypothetical protein